MVRLPVALGPLAAVLAAAAPAVARPATGGTLDLRVSATTLPADAAGARAGTAVALLPGNPPLVAIGEPRARGRAGRVQLVRAELLAGRVRKQPGPAWTGPGERARAGSALAVVGHLVGAPGADLLIGAPRAKVPGRGRPGIAFLVPGSRRTGRLRRGADRAITILGAADGDRAGAAVASVIDVDGDRRPELVIGAPRADPAGRSGAGAAYVVMSRGLKLGRVIDLRTGGRAVLRIDGPAAGARAAAALAGYPDIGSNGSGDVVVGAPGSGLAHAGAAYVVHLGPTAGVVDLAAPSGPFLVLRGAPGERAGTAVAVPGDLTGDGLPDLAIGAPRASIPGRGETGSVHIIAGGSATGEVSLANEGAVIAGEAAGDRVGASLAPAGDVDGRDGPDLLVGAPRADPLGRGNAGAAYVVSGSAAAVGADLGLLGGSGVRLAGAGGEAGSAVAGAVDVGGNSGADVLIGAPGDHPPRRPAGGSAFLQSAPQLPPSPTARPGCQAPPTSVVLDDSSALSDADPKGLRGQALQLLIGQPASEQRVIGAVEAAALPAEVFTPLKPGKKPFESQGEVVQKLVRESVRKTSPAGDLRAALDVAAQQNRSTQSAIVVAGATARVGAGPPPGFDVDVVGVGVVTGSPQEAELRALAGPNGRYASVRASEVQAQVALFDAQRRCENALPARIGDRAIRDPQRVSDLATTVRPGADYHGSAETLGDTALADLVLTWSSPDQDVELYDVSVREEDREPTIFKAEDLRRALDGQTVCVNGIRLTGAHGSTFSTLRVGLGGEDAITARHRPHKIRYRGGHDGRAARASETVQLYGQFFAPAPGNDITVPSRACG
jgi:hypothetical protein